MLKKIKNFFGRRKVKNILLAVVLLVLLAGLIGVAVKLERNVKTETLTAVSYESGSISTTTGAEIESTSDIRTRNFIAANGVAIHLKSSDKIKYKVFSYDENKEFIAATTDWQSTDIQTLPTTGSKTVSYIKITIQAINDSEISGISEIIKYSEELSVTYLK